MSSSRPRLDDAYNIVTAIQDAKSLSPPDEHFNPVSTMQDAATDSKALHKTWILLVCI